LVRVRHELVYATSMLLFIRASALRFALLVACCGATAGCKKDVAAASVGGRISVTADANGFNPAQIAVAKGVPLTLEFTRTSKDTCATKVVFPEINLSRDLPLNEVVAVEIPTGEARKLTFQCGMGMYKSSVVVQ
jgi:plastocyanin domain-containing protein